MSRLAVWMAAGMLAAGAAGAAPLETISRDTDRDFFMSPQEAKDYGIVDDVIVGKKAK